MRKMNLILLLALCCPTHAAVYEFLEDESEIHVWVPRAGLLKFAGHDHTIGAGGFAGHLHWNPERPDEAKISLNLTTASLRVMDEGVTDKQQAEIQAEMEGTAVLHVEQHAEIQFASSRITVDTSGHWEVRGVLTVRGVSNEITFPADVAFPEPERLVATGVASIQPGDFGIAPVRALGGLVRTANTIEVRFNIHGRLEDSL